ncbi:hypothetical protein ANN_06800 [Periplaneta americana]|uniref:Uncharacterized protein n=1 Tax=Periplaneta americana TaxID=6978 RepID=A0ABQ8TEH8_PERAM|nr:hypothetical protein ANN_06800 [Periplaneta americana]
MDLREVGYEDREWINLAEDRDQWRAYVEGGNEPPGSLKARHQKRGESSIFTLPTQMKMKTKDEERDGGREDKDVLEVECKVMVASGRQ